MRRRLFHHLIIADEFVEAAQAVVLAVLPEAAARPDSPQAGLGPWEVGYHTWSTPLYLAQTPQEAHHSSSQPQGHDICRICIPQSQTIPQYKASMLNKYILNKARLRQHCQWLV